MAEAAIAIPEKIFFKIGEVCDIVEVQAHVLRYWETEFPQLSPQKNRSGQRTYRRRDVEIALRIRELLYEDLYTIAGAKKRLQDEMRESSRLKIVHSEPERSEKSGKTEHHLKPVEKAEKTSILDEELEIEEVQNKTSTFEDDEMDEDTVFLDDERRDALRTLASELLELREMLKVKSPEEGGKSSRRF